MIKAALYFVGLVVLIVLYMYDARRQRRKQREYLKGFDDILQKRNERIEELEKALAEKDRLIESLNGEVGRLNAKLRKSNRITTLKELQEERDDNQQAAIN